MKKLCACLSLCLALASGLSAEWVDMKSLRVAVLDVVSRVKGEDIDTATISEMLQVALVDKREFKVVERSLLDKIIKEQQFQVSGMTEDQAARIGALAGADKVMLVSLSKFADKYILIVKGIDVSSGIVDLTDQVMSYSVEGFIDLFPVLADRLVQKARGAAVAAYKIPEAARPAGQPAVAGKAGMASPNVSAGAATASAPIPRDGLVGEWLFSGDARDTSGFGNDGRVDNAARAADRFGVKDRAYYLPGGGAIDITGLGTYQSFTICAWAKVAAPPGQDRGYQLLGADGSFQFSIGTGGTLEGNTKAGSQVSSAWTTPIRTERGAVKTDRWQFLCYARGTDGMQRLFIDGEQVKAGPSTAAPIPQYPWGCFIGGVKTAGGYFAPVFMNGSIDDVRVYNRALGPEEILALYREGGWGASR